MQSINLIKSNSNGLSVVIFYPILFGLVFVLSTQLVFNDYSIQFWAITYLVAFYNLVELVLLYRKESTLFFAKPVVLGAIVLFLLQFGGVTNFLMVRRNGEFATIYNNILVREPQWLCYSMGLVLGANVFYWLGYKLTLGRQLYNYYMKYYRGFWDFNLAKSRLLFGWFIGASIKLIINAYGAIGHKYIKLTVAGEYIPPFIMRLKVFENLSLLFFIMLLFLQYKEKKNIILRVLVILAFIFELIFAITSGARFTIIVLFVSIFMVDYIYKRRLKFYWLLIMVGVLYVSLTIIKSYKDYVFGSNSSIVKEVNPIESIQGAIEFNKQAQGNTRLTEDLKEAARLEVIGRFNYVNDMTQMIYHKDVKGLKVSDPDFLFPFLTFPFFAVFPKFYFFGVEEPKYGYWATEILNGSSRTSTAISPIAFSYLAGGITLVFTVFLFLGILMKWVGLLMYQINSAVGVILFLAIMSTLVMFDSVVPGSYINIIRYSILLPPLMWLLLRSSK